MSNRRGKSGIYAITSVQELSCVINEGLNIVLKMMRLKIHRDPVAVSIFLSLFFTASD